MFNISKKERIYRIFTVTQIKEIIGVRLESNDSDEYIQMIIDYISDYVEKITSQCISKLEINIVTNQDGLFGMQLIYGPLINILSITSINDNEKIDYEFCKDSNYLKFSNPDHSVIKIKYLAGYESQNLIPPLIKSAILCHIIAYYNNSNIEKIPSMSREVYNNMRSVKI